MSVYLLLTDETNRDRTETQQFFYGGIFFDISLLPVITRSVIRIREEAGYRPDDTFKFDTNSRPRHVSPEKFKEAKRSVLQLCERLGIKAIVCCILHDIIRNQTPEDRFKQTASYVIGRFHRFLAEYKAEGLCIMDNIDRRMEYRFASEKLQRGLKLYWGQYLKLPRIHAFAITTVNAAYAMSVLDIVLGAFRYCVNGPVNRDAAREMMKSLMNILWSDPSKDDYRFVDRGFILRPRLEKIRVPAHKQKYQDLRHSLIQLLREAQQLEPAS